MQDIDAATVRRPLELPTGPGCVSPAEVLKQRLASRVPIPDTLNHYAVLQGPVGDANDIDTLAAAIAGLAHIHIDLQKGVPQIMQGKQPLSTSQLSRLFGRSRIPDAGESDRLHAHPDASHIALLAEGSLFQLTVLHDGSRPAHPAAVAAALRSALQQAEDNRATGRGEGADIARYTAVERDAWSDVRLQLMEDVRSREAIRCAESALFIVGIDTTGGKLPADGAWEIQAQTGNGSTRWYDHSLNVAIRDGRVALVLEESLCDSLALSWLAGELLAKLRGGLLLQAAGDAPQCGGGASASAVGAGVVGDPEQLLRHHPASLAYPAAQNCIAALRMREEQGLVRSWEGRMQIPAACTITCRSYVHLLHRLKLDGDALVQTAAALAFFRQKGHMPLALHSVGLHRFEGGRNIGSVAACTSETRAFIKAACDMGPERLFDRQEKAALLCLAMVRSAEQRKAAEGGASCAESVPEGHVPHYTAERVWKQVGAGGGYRLFGTPPAKSYFHFTYHITNVETIPNEFGFVWMLDEFASYPKQFEQAIADCAALLEVEEKRLP